MALLCTAFSDPISILFLSVFPALPNSALTFPVSNGPVFLSSSAVWGKQFSWFNTAVVVYTVSTCLTWELFSPESPSLYCYELTLTKRGISTKTGAAEAKHIPQGIAKSGIQWWTEAKVPGGVQFVLVLLCSGSSSLSRPSGLLTKNWIWYP